MSDSEEVMNDSTEVVFNPIEAAQLTIKTLLRTVDRIKDMPTPEYDKIMAHLYVAQQHADQCISESPAIEE